MVPGTGRRATSGAGGTHGRQERHRPRYDRRSTVQSRHRRQGGARHRSLERPRARRRDDARSGGRDGCDQLAVTRADRRCGRSDRGPRVRPRRRRRDPAPHSGRRVEEALGPIDILVANSGGPPASPDALSFTLDQWRAGVRTAAARCDRADRGGAAGDARARLGPGAVAVLERRARAEPGARALLRRIGPGCSPR